MFICAGLIGGVCVPECESGAYIDPETLSPEFRNMDDRIRDEGVVVDT